MVYLLKRNVNVIVRKAEGLTRQSKDFMDCFTSFGMTENLGHVPPLSKMTNEMTKLNIIIKTDTYRA